jgi:hypothetical protein
MDLRTLAVGFVAVLLAGMMTFVIVTNDERVSSSQDHGHDEADTAAAVHGESDQPGHSESHGGGEHAGDHTTAGGDAHSATANHADGHPHSANHWGSAAGAHGIDDHGHAGPADAGGHAMGHHLPGASAHPGGDHLPGPHTGEDHPPDPGTQHRDDHGPTPGGLPASPGDASSGVTPEQAAAAARLLADTKAGLEQWRDEDTVAGAGFRSIGDDSTGYEHFINWNWIDDGIVLDPNHPESLVYRVTLQGRVLEAAMYMLPFGTADEDIPDIGGTLTQWHIHNDLCFTPPQIVDGYPQRRVMGLTDAAGDCDGGEKLPISPMLHVWIVDNPCGPFASLEGVGGGQAVNEPQDPNADPTCQHSAH